ncbi:MAG: Crp/Fnr family transcriptional regulator [Chloroflexi bacterium]|nr:Crp/Fnr family transcriptional regulator [Chloroflexota bacterium]
MKTTNQIQFLKETALFADIADGQLKAIAQDIVPRRYEQGDIIFHEGDPGHSLYLVQSGQIRIFINGMDGSETSVILFGKPGDIFGELAVIDGLTRSASAVALDKTVLCTMSRENFRQQMRRCPQLALNFMKILSKRVRYNTQQMDSFATLAVPKRLARKLLELAQSYGRVETNGVRIHMTLTQTHLASLIGATRESANKSLRAFRQKGWIQIQQGQILILDPDALRAQVTG